MPVRETLRKANRGELEDRITELEAENDELQDRLDSIRGIAANGEDPNEEDEE
jgi:hypothetical protein